MRHFFGVVVGVGLCLFLSVAPAFAGKEGPISKGEESPDPCVLIHSAMPSCSAGCLVVAACTSLTGFDAETCKTCEAQEPALLCFLGRDFGWCLP